MRSGETPSCSSGMRIEACGATSVNWEGLFKASMATKYKAAALAVLLAVTLLASSSITAQQSPSSAVASAATHQAHQALVSQYCVTCHNQRSKTAGVMFDTLSLTDVGKDAEIWEKAVRKLRGGMMPPPNARQPQRTAIDALVSFLETSL